VFWLLRGIPRRMVCHPSVLWAQAIETQASEIHHTMGEPWDDASLPWLLHKGHWARGGGTPPVSVWALVGEGVAWLTWGTPSGCQLP